MEPYKLRRWKRPGEKSSLSFFTCARPGRSKGRSGKVEDAIVSRWARNLPGLPDTVIISLLGTKPDGMSEYAFYSFRGGWETDSRKPTFQQWLAEKHPELHLTVIEYPTQDFQPIPPDILERIGDDIERNLADGKTVVVVDSGGETRTRQVCKFLGLVEDTGRM